MCARVLLLVFHVRALHPSISGSRSVVCEALATMKRVFEKGQFEALAAKATLAAPADVLRRFYVPVCGTLTCTFAGPQKPDAQEFIVYNTLVTFKWELRGPRVQGTVCVSWEAHIAMRMLANSGVPFRLKRPLIVAFLHKEFGRRRRFPADTRLNARWSDLHVRFHSISCSKPIVEPLRKAIVKRQYGPDMEAPICARVSDKHSLACLPGGPEARSQFGLTGAKLRKVVDDGSSKPTTGVAAHAKRFDLPADLSAYDKRPWRCLRDAVAQAHFRAEEMRALSEGRAVDVDRAMSALETCAFEWDQKECFSHTTVFVIWTSVCKTEKAGIRYHLRAATLRRLCLKAGLRKK